MGLSNPFKKKPQNKYRKLKEDIPLFTNMYSKVDQNRQLSCLFKDKHSMTCLRLIVLMNSFFMDTRYVSRRAPGL